MSVVDSGTDPRDSKDEVDGVRLKWGENNAIVAAITDDEVLEYDAATIEAGPSDEASIFQTLTEGVRDQDDFHRDITNKARLLLREKEDAKDEQRIEKAKAKIVKLSSQKQHRERRLNTQTLSADARKGVQEHVNRLISNITVLEKEIVDIQLRIDERHQLEHEDDIAQEVQHPVSKRMPNESHREFLIRTGKITPFSELPRGDLEGSTGGLTDALFAAEVEAEAENKLDVGEPRSHQNLRIPGFVEIDCGSSTPGKETPSRNQKKRRLKNGDAFRTAVSDGEEAYSSEHWPSDEESDDSFEIASRRRKVSKKGISDTVDLTCIDDGDEDAYHRRLKSWVTRRSKARKAKQEEWLLSSSEGNEEEWFMPSPDAPDYYLGEDLKLPGDIYPALFDYQKTGVQWLGELYSKQVGGIIGDEMGLGKTIQMISFLASLHYSKKLTKPVIVIAPATVLKQWVNEFHRWWPPLRVSILHTSGSGMLNVRDDTPIEDDEEQFTSSVNRKSPRSHKLAKQIVDRVVELGHVLVTTYTGLQTYGKLLIPIEWGYAILDEGHKIRNPNAAVTVYCKELQTTNRVILSGTPIQNNLAELWSLFDFAYPMRLGTLVDFKARFEIPIKVGGYANATNAQIMVATKCAQSLKETISPYLLQRLKIDVATDLPKKSEQVLFCKLTKSQREAYEVFLKSDDMGSILQQTRQPLYGIDILRKICNHPDLLDPSLKQKPGYKWGEPKKSGKMQVVKALLQIWKNGGDKVLLFSQGVLMLNIIEQFVKGLEGFSFLRMDGSTNVKDRQHLVDRFNNDPDLNVFLLTTKVGGLGVNLTGANRVIIFDPDWNPSTDVQARERAWRLGQKKEVSIYRLMTAGTIEEKIYHRQVFKQFLTDKVLKDPKLRQSFSVGDLYNLFTLGSSDGSTETGTMFQGTEVQLKRVGETDDHNNESAGNGRVARQPEVPYHDTAKSFDDGQLRSLDAVTRVEAFRDDGTAAKKTAEAARFLDDIFAANGVHSVLEHEQVLNPGQRDVETERYAESIAESNEQSLRRAAKAARNLPVGTVTWTGRVGEAGRPTRRWRVRGVLGTRPASTDVLSSLSRQPANTAASSARNVVTRSHDFAELIRDYIHVQGGSVPTNMLLDHFNPMCRTPAQSSDFRVTLQNIAVLKKAEGSSRMRGRWELKPAYK